MSPEDNLAELLADVGVDRSNGHRPAANEPEDYPDELLDQDEPGASRDRTEAEFLDPSLQPVDLGPILAGNAVQPLPDQLTRHDGRCLLYPAAVNGLHGDSGSGKGWVVCVLIAENARRGQRTMLIDLEDTAWSIVARLLAMGMEPAAILRSLVYVRPQVPLRGLLAVGHLVELVRSHNVSTIVVDSLGEAFSLEGVNEDRDNEVGPWLRNVARPLADAGPAVVLVDHSTKAADNPLHPSGSKRKRAAITGASYLVEATQPFVKDEGGRLRLVCAKDRHGNYRRGQKVADLVMESGDGRVDLRLYAASNAAVSATAVTIVAARSAVEAVKAAGSPQSRTSLVGLMTIKAGTDAKRGGIDYAIAKGALVEENGPRGARLCRYVGDLEVDE